MREHTHSTSPETNPTTISIPQLRAVLNGRVIAPNNAGYDEARAVFSGGIGVRQPAAASQQEAGNSRR